MKINVQTSERTLCFFLSVMTVLDSEMKPSRGPALPGLQEPRETCAAARCWPGTLGVPGGLPEGAGVPVPGLHAWL